MVAAFGQGVVSGREDIDLIATHRDFIWGDEGVAGIPPRRNAPLRSSLATASPSVFLGEVYLPTTFLP
jgi:hypothetical protein